jgi:glycosyltransferase involved in cell wall biosynthesis
MRVPNTNDTSAERTRVLFAPDYRAGLPYQALLAKALTRFSFEITFQSDYYRGLPLYRGAQAANARLVHLHWPEKYFQHKGDGWDRFRVVRYPLDLWLTSRRYPLVMTAHNLLPHNRHNEPEVFQNVQSTAKRARAIFVHSDVARREMCRMFGVSQDRCHVIPYGDHAAAMGRPLARDEARQALQLPREGKICLMFGTVSPYKGSDEVIDLWVQCRLPYQLLVVGPVLAEGFARTLRELSQKNPSVELRLTEEWLDDAALRCWLSAVDCTIFNYKEIFTSGAAALARSFGVPLLIPRRLSAADLDEPHSHVLRFDDLKKDFIDQLQRALTIRPDYDVARAWRAKTGWEEVAAITASVYQEILFGKASVHSRRTSPGQGQANSRTTPSKPVL